MQYVQKEFFIPDNVFRYVFQILQKRGIATEVKFSSGSGGILVLRSRRNAKKSLFPWPKKQGLTTTSTSSSSRLLICRMT